MNMFLFILFGMVTSVIGFVGGIYVAEDHFKDTPKQVEKIAVYGAGGSINNSYYSVDMKKNEVIINKKMELTKFSPAISGSSFFVRILDK